MNSCGESRNFSRFNKLKDLVLIPQKGAVPFTRVDPARQLAYRPQEDFGSTREAQRKVEPKPVREGFLWRRAVAVALQHA